MVSYMPNGQPQMNEAPNNTLPSVYNNEVLTKPIIPKPAAFTLVNKITNMLQAFRSSTDAPEDLIPPEPNETFSRMGARKVGFNHIIRFMMISPNYQQAVRDAKALAESNPVFSPIIRKLTMTVAEAADRVEFDDSPKGKKAEKIIEAMLKRTQWSGKKAEFIRAMLCEGGLSLEVIVSSKSKQIDKLEYRPHETIWPVQNQGVFDNPKLAYVQRDEYGRVLANFALWQLIDVNLEESVFHPRGVPHLQAARQLLEYVGAMSKGLMQKWLRESGSIEHFNLEDAKKWEDMTKFQEENQETLNASPENLVRQFFTKGKVKIERLFADSSAHDTGSIEFMLELIFLCAGISKELMGFKSHVVIRDMIELSMDNYFQTLNKIQSRMHAALRKAVDLELLLHGLTPEDVPYQIIGGAFEVARQVHITEGMIKVGAVSVNDLRKAANLAPYTNRLFDVPGFYINPLVAFSLAKAAGIEIPDDIAEMAADNQDELGWNTAKPAKKNGPQEIKKEDVAPPEKKSGGGDGPGRPSKGSSREVQTREGGTAPAARSSSVKDSRLFDTVPDRSVNITKLIDNIVSKRT